MIPAWLGITSGSVNVIHDPFFSSVVQLAHFDGTNGSTTFTNSCPRGNTLTSNAVCSLTTAQFQWGTASVRMNSALAGARGASHADYNFSTNDFTIELWIRPDTLNLDNNSSKVYFDMRDASLTAAWVPTISASNASGNLQYRANGATQIVGANVIVAATWQYIALCRNSGTTRLFHGVAGGNATQVGSNFTDSNTYIQSQMTVGAAGNFGGSVIGDFDDLRVTNGVGRYTTTFSVPAAPFPNQ